MATRSFRIEPAPGFTPNIGRLVAILSYARQTTLAAVDGMGIAELDHLHDESSNSVGALLAHIAVLERGYQCVTFENREPSADELAAWEPALKLGADGRRLLRGQPLTHYVGELSAVRGITLEGLAVRDDRWLDESVRAAPAMNVYWAWFHVIEEEINHRGQIRWLRSRLRRVGGS